jgi:C1A family cysteine protease
MHEKGAAITSATRQRIEGDNEQQRARKANAACTQATTHRKVRTTANLQDVGAAADQRDVVGATQLVRHQRAAKEAKHSIAPENVGPVFKQYSQGNCCVAAAVCSKASDQQRTGAKVQREREQVNPRKLRERNGMDERTDLPNERDLHGEHQRREVRLCAFNPD